MDPKVTYALMLSSIEEDDTSAAREHYYNLRDWMSRGGFAPKELEAAHLREAFGVGFARFVRTLRDDGLVD